MKLFEDMNVLNERYQWTESTPSKGKLLFQHFVRALKGERQRKWAKLVRTQRTFTVDAFQSKFHELVEEIFGEDVYEDMFDYLCDTKMPTDMNAADFVD